MLHKIIIGGSLIVSLFFATASTEVTYTAVEEAPEHEIIKLEVKKQVELLPELVPICACESSFEGTKYGKPQQFEKDGVTVRYGRVDNDDRGMCQINRRYHGETSKKMGMDIETEEGNILYANWLYEQQGNTPWKWSTPCWN